MSELDKLEQGDWYDFLDPAVVARKTRAAQLCQELMRFQQLNRHNKWPKTYQIMY